MSLQRSLLIASLFLLSCQGAQQRPQSNVINDFMRLTEKTFDLKVELMRALNESTDTSSSVPAAVSKLNQVLGELQQLDLSSLNTVKPDLQNIITTEWITAIRKIVDGYKTKNADMMVEGIKMSDLWLYKYETEIKPLLIKNTNKK